MSKVMKIDKKSVVDNYKFLGILIGAMVLGCIFGFANPTMGVDANGEPVYIAQEIYFLGQIFINMMFCIVVPMVFASIAGSIASMKNMKRATSIVWITVAVFVVTGLIAAFIMFVIMKAYPPVLESWKQVESEEMGEYASLATIVTNFLTSNDFVGLLSRRAMLPLIVFSILFGFATNVVEKGNGVVTQLLCALTNVMLKVVNIVTYYAPIAFFAIFAGLVSQYGSMITKSYARAMQVYYPLCFLYLFIAFPIYAWFGGGKGAAKKMFEKISRPAIVSLGMCSSVATIPTNMEVAEETGISKDVSNIVLPLGATMHMDGSCFSCVLKIAFVFGVFGMPFTWGKLPLILLVAVFSSVGMSGVPGGGYIGEYIICNIFFADKMNLAFPILIMIGNLVDPPATMVNAAGDYVVSFIVSKYVDGKDWFKKAWFAQQTSKLKKKKK